MREKIYPNGGDIAHRAAKSVLGTIPYAGTSASELLRLILTPLLEKRRNEWIKSW